MKFDPETCRAMYEASGWSHRKLAKHFGVSMHQVQKAIDPEARRARLNRWKKAHPNPEMVSRHNQSYYHRHKDAIRMSRKLGIPIPDARAILEQRAAA